MSLISPAATAEAVRDHLISRGYAPVPLYAFDDLSVAEKDRGKRPASGLDWPDKAQAQLATGEIDPTPGETGIACAGLRVIDVDVDDPALANALRTLSVTLLGEAPVRFRANSPRVALVYRSADPEARKRVIKSPTLRNHNGKPARIEILGLGQQLAAFGRHYTGALLEWDRDLPPAADLPVVGGAQEDRFVRSAEVLLRVEPEQTQRVPERLPAAPPLASAPARLGEADVRAALAEIDGGDDYDLWLRIGAAVKDAAGGAPWGLQAFHEWSVRWSNYRARACDQKFWHGLDRVHAGTLIYEARQRNPSFVTPSVRVKLGAVPMPPSAAAANRDDEEFRMLSPLEIDALPEPVWLLPGLLAEKSLGVLYGAPGSMKSFVTLDVAYRLAHGLDDDGAPRAPRSVLYVIGEGEGGIRKRQQAWYKANGLKLADNPRFRLVARPVNLLDAGEVQRFISRIQAQGADGFDLVVVDTLARCMVGSPESAQEVMSAAVASADRIRRTFDTAVLFVHHTGKDADRGPRGSSVLLGAVDSAIEAERADGGTVVRLRVTKLKEDDDKTERLYEARVMELGVDGQGRLRTSLALRRLVEAPAAALPAKHDLKALLLRYRIAEAMQIGEHLPIAQLIKRLDMSKGSTTYNTIRAALPCGELLTVDLADGERRHLMRRDKAADPEMVQCVVAAAAK